MREMTNNIIEFKMAHKEEKGVFFLCFFVHIYCHIQHSKEQKTWEHEATLSMETHDWGPSCVSL